MCLHAHQYNFNCWYLETPGELIGTRTVWFLNHREDKSWPSWSETWDGTDLYRCGDFRLHANAPSWMPSKGSESPSLRFSEHFQAAHVWTECQSNLCFSETHCHKGIQSCSAAGRDTPGTSPTQPRPRLQAFLLQIRNAWAHWWQTKTVIKEGNWISSNQHVPEKMPRRFHPLSGHSERWSLSLLIMCRSSSSGRARRRERPSLLSHVGAGWSKHFGKALCGGSRSRWRPCPLISLTREQWPPHNW